MRMLRVLLAGLMVAGWISAGTVPVLAAKNLTVPYIDQILDVPDGFDGSMACGAVASVMILAYHGKIAAHPIQCSNPVPHTSDYGFYVSETYTNSQGYTFNLVATDPSGSPARGAYGYVYYPGTVLRNRVVDYLGKHGLVAWVDMSPTEAEVKAEIDAGNPVYASTKFTATGHEVVIKGYTDSGYYVVNDPLYGENNTYTWSLMGTGTRYIIIARSGDSQPPSVTVGSPNGGEKRKVGARYDITWSATDDVGATSVDIYYSTDNGSNYHAIATGEANDGTYSWVVPDAVSTTCRVKVVARDAAGNSGEDTSNAGFEICQVLPGDADNDGRVVSPDISRVMSIILGLDASIPDADANQDGSVNALDITRIEKIIAGS